MSNKIVDKEYTDSQDILLRNLYSFCCFKYKIKEKGIQINNIHCQTVFVYILYYIIIFN